MKTIVCKCCKHEREVFSGTELASIRKRAGFSLREISMMLGLSISFISDCEHNRRNASLSMTDFYKGLT